VSGTDPTRDRARSKDELDALVRRAQQGDETALPALRVALQHPKLVDMLGGDLAREAERSLIDKATGTNLAFREALQRKLELLRAELAGSSPTPVERLLAERIAACWLHLHHAEIRLAQREHDLTLAQAEYHQRCRDRAHKRYLSALKALAQVRKLALPAMQFNIANKQQVNNPPG
jgi:hypothetical protein